MDNTTRDPMPNNAGVIGAYPESAKPETRFVDTILAGAVARKPIGNVLFRAYGDTETRISRAVLGVSKAAQMWPSRT
jgi:hypothetical protein